MTKKNHNKQPNIEFSQIRRDYDRYQMNNKEKKVLICKFIFILFVFFSSKQFHLLGKFLLAYLVKSWQSMETESGTSGAFAGRQSTKNKIKDKGNK